VVEQIQALMDRGQYTLAARMAQGCLMAADLPHIDQVEVALLGYRASMVLRDGYRAANFARRAHAAAQACGGEELEGRACFALGTARLVIGDYVEAKELLQTFLTGLEDRWPALREQEISAYINLGMSFRDRKQYADALEALTRALTLCEAAGDTRRQIKTRQMMAWVLILNDALDEAAVHLDLCDALIPLPDDLSASQLTHRAMLALQRGDNGTAMELGLEIMQPARPGVSDANRALACYITGKVAMNQGDINLARTMATSAQEYAVKDGLSSIINLINQLRISLHQVESNRPGEDTPGT